jgi:hypothetical protein
VFGRPKERNNTSRCLFCHVCRRFKDRSYKAASLAANARFEVMQENMRLSRKTLPKEDSDSNLSISASLFSLLV